jgi:hypothetical protein
MRPEWACGVFLFWSLRFVSFRSSRLLYLRTIIRILFTLISLCVSHLLNTLFFLSVPNRYFIYAK